MVIGRKENTLSGNYPWKELKFWTENNFLVINIWLEITILKMTTAWK